MLQPETVPNPPGRTPPVRPNYLGLASGAVPKEPVTPAPGVGLAPPPCLCPGCSPRSVPTAALGGARHLLSPPPPGSRPVAVGRAAAASYVCIAAFTCVLSAVAQTCPCIQLAGAPARVLGGRDQGWNQPQLGHLFRLLIFRERESEEGRGTTIDVRFHVLMHQG